MSPPPMIRRDDDVYQACNAVVTGDVTLGREVNLWFNVVVRGDVAPVILGDRVNLQDGVIVHTDYGVPNNIEANVVVGHGAILHGRRIGAGCLIGMGAVILSNSEIGPECVIAAGAVVAEGMKIPPRSLVMGVPAKVVKPVSEKLLERAHYINAHYLTLAKRYVDGDFPLK